MGNVSGMNSETASRQGAKIAKAYSRSVPWRPWRRGVRPLEPDPQRLGVRHWLAFCPRINFC